MHKQNDGWPISCTCLNGFVLISLFRSDSRAAIRIGSAAIGRQAVDFASLSVDGRGRPASMISRVGESEIFTTALAPDTDAVIFGASVSHHHCVRSFSVRDSERGQYEQRRHAVSAPPPSSFSRPPRDRQLREGFYA